MMGIGPIEMLFVLIAAGGTLGLPISLPPLPPDAVIERAVPEKCLLLAYSAGVAQPNASSSNQTEQLLAEKEVQEFIGQLKEQISKVLEQAGDKNPEMTNPARFGGPALALLLSRPMAFYISHLEVRQGGPPDVRAALLVNCGKQVSDVQRWLADLEKLAAANHAPVDEIKEVKVGKVALRQLALPGGPELSWGIKGEYFLLTIGPGAAQELVERISQRGKNAAWFDELKQQAGIPRLSTLGYLNVPRLLEIVEPQIPDPQALQVIDALGLRTVKLVASASGLDQRGVVNRSFVNLDGSPQGIFEVFAGKPLALDQLKVIPRETTFAAVFRLDAAAVYQRALERIGKVEPQAVAEWRQNVAGLERGLGFQIDQGLLASLGDLWTVHNSGSGGAIPFTGLVITLSVRDRAKLEDVEKKLLAMVEAQAGRGPGGPPFTIRESKLRDVTVHQVVPKGPVPVSPAWCILDDRLVVAATIQALKDQLSRDDKSPSLAEVPEVAERFKGSPQPTLVTFNDARVGLRGVYTLVQTYGPMATGALAQQGIDFDLPPLPSLKVVEPHVLPQVGVMRRTKQGLLKESYETLPLVGNFDVGTTGVLVALLLPAVQAAREAARRNQSSNNLKQIALSMMIYHDQQKHFPPAAIADKAGKPLLSWRVALLPYMEEQQLYKQFHLDEPWDSPHNRALVDKMPVVYSNPSQELPAGQTAYLAPTGDKTVFSGKQGMNMKEIRDGTSRTILVVEAAADRAVPWTKPDDLTVDLKQPLAGLRGARTGAIFLAAFCDGSVRAISEQTDPQVLGALFTPAGGEAVAVPDP